MARMTCTFVYTITIHWSGFISLKLIPTMSGQSLSTQHRLSFSPAVVCSRSRNNIITGCAVAQHCCKGDQPFQWETPIFGPPIYPKALNFSEPKFAQMIMSSISPDVQNLVKIRLRRGFPTNRWNITLAWLFVPFLFFLPFCSGKTTELILRHDSLYDTVLCKEVSFGGYKIFIQHFNLFFTKIWNITITLMGKIKQFF